MAHFQQNHSLTFRDSGLGFALCCRLIDEFLYTRPQSQTLHILFSTRDASKSEDTLQRLKAHLQKSLREANGTTLGISLLLEARVKLEGFLVDLLKLSTVKALAEQLLRRGQQIDAVVWNAGIAGWTGLNWPKAIWSVLTDLVHATTYPMYMNCDVGLLTKPQTASKNGISEPRLGQVFTANVFGHYLLTHWLSPLMTGASRIVCISSISAVPDTYSPEDLQALKSSSAYESSKRLTDLLCLTSELPSSRSSVQSFLPASTPDSRPKMYVVHPGVCGTSIAGLHWIMDLLMFAAFYVARWLGSPWHVVAPYKGAVSAAFAVLSSQLPSSEEHDGKGKWGSATGVTGDERVSRSMVDGWGYCGQVGVVPTNSVTGSTGRWRGSKSLTAEGREEFEVLGRDAWKEMEELRKEWESILGPIDQSVSTVM